MSNNRCNHIFLWVFIIGLIVGTAVQIAKLRERADDMAHRIKLLELRIQQP